MRLSFIGSTLITLLIMPLACTTIKEKAPSAIEESIAPAAEESMPATVEEATPTIVEEGTPTTAEESAPPAVEESTPATVEESIPATTDEAPLATVEPSIPPMPGEQRIHEVVVLKDTLQLDPPKISIRQGDTVRWLNQDGRKHFLASIPGSGPTDKLEIFALMDPGNVYKHTFNVPGEYPYFCFIHNQMTGHITVLKEGS